MEKFAKVPPEKIFKKLRNWLEAKMYFNASTSTTGTGIWVKTRVIAKTLSVKKSLFLSFSLANSARIFAIIFSTTRNKNQAPKPKLFFDCATQSKNLFFGSLGNFDSLHRNFFIQLALLDDFCFFKARINHFVEFQTL